MKRTLIMLATVVGLSAGINAGGASPASAGGIYNFYNAKNCTARSGTLVGKITNYDINIQTDQRYHHSANNPYGAWYLSGVYYDGKQWPNLTNSDRKGYSGTKYDGYQDFGNMIADHDIMFLWTDGQGNFARCFVGPI